MRTRYKTADAPRPDQVLSRIHATTDYTDLADVDFLVENTIEKWDVKREVYPRLDSVTSGRWRCRIEEIRIVDYRRMKADLRAQR